MDLSPAETALIEMLRGEVAPSFTISITRTESHVVITTANPDDGVIIGAGPDFETAYLSLCGVDPNLDASAAGEPASSRH